MGACVCCQNEREVVNEQVLTEAEDDFYNNSPNTKKRLNSPVIEAFNVQE